MLVSTAALVACLLLPPGPAAAQGQADNWTPPRTAWGEPDLQGVWRNETGTPLERPAALAGKEFLTDEDVAEQERRENDQRARRLAEEVKTRDGTGLEAYNSFWQDRGTERRVHRRTSLIVDPSDGKIPFKPEARKKEDFEEERYGRGPFNTWRDIDTGERCITDGLPGSVWTGTAGGPQQIRQGRGYVLLMGEQFHDRRIVPTDGRAHGTVRHWLGESIGRWEGNTLVIETRNFLDRSNERWVAPWRASTETLRTVERLTRVAPDTIEYTLTVEAPAKFTRPWAVELPLTKLDQHFLEYACHEGNYGIIHTLSGARAQEKSQSSGPRR